MFPTFIIQGPTASGKSLLAVALARQCQGRVINMDSMQVYADLEVLTARPDQTQLDAAPHDLYGYVDAAQRFGVGQWLQDVRQSLKQMAMDNFHPIFCGGTGLYARALTQGLVDTPDIADCTRDQVLSDYQHLGHVGMIARLQQKHPAALIHIADVVDQQRLLRAAEVVYQTGQSLSDWYSAQSGPAVVQAFRVVVSPPRQALYNRIDRRCAAMLRDAQPEVAALLARDLDSGLPLMRAIGVDSVRGVREGTISFTEALARFSRQTRHYAKRQLTWLRHQVQADLVWDDFCTTDNVARVVKAILSRSAAANYRRPN